MVLVCLKQLPCEQFKSQSFITLTLPWLLTAAGVLNNPNSSPLTLVSYWGKSRLWFSSV